MSALCIKITDDHADDIKKALAAVNGRARCHIYSHFEEIKYLAEKAEIKLGKLLNKKDFPGARWTETSGLKVANKYKHTRLATEVTLERRSAAWYLINARVVSISVSGGGAGSLYLTEEQDVAAKEKLSKNYHILRKSA